jgi:hypothetical protein
MKAQNVWVYRNLRHGRKARPLYSVMRNGRVIARVHRILLGNVRFVVRESRRQKVLRDGCKNVHAFVVGRIAWNGAMGIDKNGKDLPIRIRYNPYASGQFWTETGGVDYAVQIAGAALLNERGLSAAYLNI